MSIVGDRMGGILCIILDEGDFWGIVHEGGCIGNLEVFKKPFVDFQRVRCVDGGGADGGVCVREGSTGKSAVVTDLVLVACDGFVGGA
jgi:hypothetical protein